MRFLTVAIIAGALALVLAVAVFIRMEPETEPVVTAEKSAPAGKKPMGRSDRVEDRLSQLRSEYDRRKPGGAMPAAPAPDARVKDLPPRQPGQLPPAAPAAGVDPDDEMDDEDRAEFEEQRNTLLSDPDPDERIGAILMLTGADDEQVKATLMEAMQDPDAEVRLAVVEALGDYSDDLSPEVLNPAINDPDAEVRFEAVSILGDMETAEALAMVRGALNDPDEEVRSLASGILEMADDEE